MAKKKNINENDIILFYMDYVLEHNHQPKSVSSFTKHNNFEELKFYEFFDSFETVEKHVFKAFHDNTIIALNKSVDYSGFEPRNKLLSYYYTFFENLTANRSYVVYALHKQNNSLKSYKSLAKLKSSFSHYIQDLGIELIDVKEDRLEKIQNRGLKETAWLQLLLTMKYWMDDDSPSFGKTDIFIEKSVNTSFDALNIAPLKSLIDFGKFIFKEKIKKS
ncbi:TetR family transcriptional regulator C-terminal domain-containing protein [Lacinutrix sp. Bg11-31]|uniref:TetR family transcriptional regulator C-terminal domain-containing protein n=1 Tax=Lacinutrix sp. Bg11-31 TaxID=2057808 RepID=UPI000C304C21|nr:TetR family transcriptional regulator C-terminal domain-containing protein [Lacinutrix sp. Bg11-31]AUC81571.1 heat-shock protein [Lacinutrix sp. Bg11-31]